MRITKFVDALYLALLLIWCVVVYAGWFKLTCDPAYFDRHYISFGKFYSVGRIVFSKDSQRLYDPAFQRERLADLVNPRVLPQLKLVDGVQTFPDGFAEHPPQMFMLYAPFTVLKPIWALRLYTPLCWLLGVAGLVWLTRTAKTLNVPQTLALAVGATACFPSCFALMLGQPTWFVVGMYSAYMSLWLMKRECLPGFILALTTIKPQYPIFFALPALVTRRWRLLLWAVLFGGLLLLACILLVGWHRLLAYVVLLARMNSSSGFTRDDIAMPSVRGLVSNFFGAAVAIKAGGVFAILALILRSFIWWRTDKVGKDPRWAFCITLLSLMLFSPHIFRYDSLFLVLTAALTLDSLSLFRWQSSYTESLPSKWAADKAFIVWRFLFITYPVTSLLLVSCCQSAKVITLIEFCSNSLLLLLAVWLWSCSCRKTTDAEPVAA